ncbi:MAG: oligosaccharide flippase family protein [Bacteroidetes bacterium]|nr:oligosaccharide flippase family protein [Fibrella sp.]
MGIIQRQTIQSTVFTYAGTALGFVTTTLLIPRVMNLDQVGLINLLPSWMILLAYVANLGINGAANRYFTYFRDYDRQHNGFLLVSIGVSLIGFLLAMGLLIAFKPIILETNQERSVLFADNYYLLIPLTFSLLFFNLFDTYAKLLYDTVTGTLLQQVVQRVLTLAVVGAYALGWLTFSQFLPVWLLTWLLPAGLMADKIGVDQQFHLSPGFVRITPDMRRQLASYSSLTLLTGLSSQVIVQIDKIMVNQSLGLAAVAIYATCANFGIVIAIPATALYKVSGVIIADSWKNNDLANISQIYRKSCLNQLLIGSLVFVGIAANLPNLFRILPPAYESGYFVILWLGAGKLIDMATGVNGQILNTSRYYAYDTLFFAILVVSTIAFTYYGVKLAGLNGAAVAAALATAIFNAGRTWFVWYKFGLQPFGWQNAAILVVAGLTWGLAAAVPYPATSPIGLAADIAVRSVGITALFVGLVYTLKLSPDANQVLLSLARRFNRFF